MKKPQGVIAVPVLLIAVVVAGLLAGGSYWYAQSKNKVTANVNTGVTVNTNTAVKTTPDVDAYGCAISTGYLWCEQKQKCVRAWEEPCTSTQTETLANTVAKLPVQKTLSTYDYLGSVSVVNLRSQFPEVQLKNINTISNIGDKALIGGDKLGLYFYDGVQLSDISRQISKDATSGHPRVHEIGNNGKYWLFSVYGSNYLKFYKFDGTAVSEITLPSLPKVQSSWTPEEITWTGEYFLMFLGGSLYKYDGTTFTEIKELSTTYLYDVSIAWNGNTAMMVIPDGNGPSAVYAYSNEKFTSVEGPDEHFTSVAYNGEYWLFGGAKFTDRESLPILYKYQKEKWINVTSQVILAKDKGGPILDIAWSGTYWVINAAQAVYIMKGEKITQAKEIGSYWNADVEFGDTYGLIGSGAGSGGGNLIKIITKDRSEIKTVQSSRLFECFSANTINKQPELVSFLASKNFTATNFFDLCVATSSNPQKRFFVISPTATRYDEVKKSVVSCEHCFAYQAFSLENGASLLFDGGQQQNEVLLYDQATTCEFGAREDDILLVQCAMQKEKPEYMYYNLLQSHFSTDYPQPYFQQQCSTWVTDASEPLLKGEYEKELHFYSGKVKVRCGDGPLPAVDTWATYSQDGFSFRYPKNFYFREYIADGVHHFIVHQRNLDGGEGGGPANDMYIRLKPVTTYAELLAQVKVTYNFTGEYPDKLQETTVGDVKKIVVTPAPGMCGGEYVFMLGTKYVLEYGQYCGSWQGLDKTFVLN